MKKNLFLIIVLAIVIISAGCSNEVATSTEEVKQESVKEEKELSVDTYYEIVENSKDMSEEELQELFLKFSQNLQPKDIKVKIIEEDMVDQLVKEEDKEVIPFTVDYVKHASGWSYKDHIDVQKIYSFFEDTTADYIRENRIFEKYISELHKFKTTYESQGFTDYILVSYDEKFKYASVILTVEFKTTEGTTEFFNQGELVKDMVYKQDYFIYLRKQEDGNWKIVNVNNEKPYL